MQLRISATEPSLHTLPIHALVVHSLHVRFTDIVNSSPTQNTTNSKKRAIPNFDLAPHGVTSFDIPCM